MLTTKTSRFVVLLVVAFLIWTPTAYAWSWPVQGPVLQPFSYDAAHPYAAGQHRGIDIGASSAGENVVAPAAGTVSFAGTVAANGESVTIQTPDGYSVTLTHLGSILVARGAVVGEGDAVGTVGPSGTPEVDGPYVHLGIRTTDDPNGYLDPLGLLPPAATGGGTDGSSPSQPGAGSGSSTASPGAPSTSTGSTSTTSTTPASSDARSRPTSRSHAQSRTSDHGRARSGEGRSAESGSRVESDGFSHHPSLHHPQHAARASRPEERPLRAERPQSSSRRPVVETAAPTEPTGLDAGHETRPSAPVAHVPSSPRRTPTALAPLVLNGAAALVALAAAFTAAHGRRRRRRATSPVAGAQVLRLPRASVERRPTSRAA